MSTMVCGRCDRYGIYWKNLGGMSPYTYCPNCGGTNCQKPEEPQEWDDGPDEEDSNLNSGEIESLKAEIEKAKKEAAERAKIEAEAKIKREAGEKAEKERLAKIAAEKKAARAPDKVKILLIADVLDSIQTPDVKTEDGKAVALSIMMSIAALIKTIRDEAEAL